MELFDDEIEERTKQPVRGRVLGTTPRYVPPPEVAPARSQAIYTDDDEQPKQGHDWYMDWYFPEAILYTIQCAWARPAEEVDVIFARVSGMVNTSE